MIDFNKPVQTRDGRKVRILCTDMDGEPDTVVGIVGDGPHNELVHSWKANGHFMFDDVEEPLDLINVPETRVVWVNMYPDGVASFYSMKEDADGRAASDRHACIRVEYTVGQFDE